MNDDDRLDSKPSAPRRAWAAAAWFLFKKPPSYVGTIIIGVVAIVLAGLLTTLISFLIKPLSSSSKVPGYVFIIIGSVSLLAGLLIAWGLTRQYYKLLMRALSTELALYKDKVATWHEPRDRLRRLSIYASHIYNLLESLILDRVSIRDLTSTAASRILCAAPARYLSTATELGFCLSIWAEAAPRRRDRAAARIADRLPGSRISDAAAELIPGPHFNILAAPNHSDEERESFATARVAPSWLKYHQLQEHEPTSEQREDGPHVDEDTAKLVYRANAPYTALAGDDISAFDQFDYKSVRAVAFSRDDTVHYLVALSKHEDAFHESEERYLLWLKRVLELSGALGEESVAA